jgi:aryl-alcohol dehydrogenase-like predicted oxidoreductase
VEQRRFGDSDLTCSALGFGTWEMSTTQYGEIDVQQASAAVGLAIDSGITLFDTAEIYGPYHSEELLGKALGKRRQEVVLVTKVGFDIDEEGHTHGKSSAPELLTAHAEGCLRRLGTEWIDLLLIHWPDHTRPYEDSIGALVRLQEAGKIRHYGVSNYNIEMMERCETRGHLTANQVGYHLFDRRMEKEVLPYLQAHGIGFMAYGTLGFGLLGGAFTPETTFAAGDWRSQGTYFGLPLFEREVFLKELRVVERLKALAADYGKSVAQLGIAWVLSNPAVTVGLVGVRNPRELAENVAATEWRLTDADRAAIDEIFVSEGVPTYIDTPQAI